jgi:hypothetical protein
MTLDNMNNMGTITFTFDKPMVVPGGYGHWKGNNTYLNTTGLFDVWYPNTSIPLDFSVYPGEL